MHSLNVVSALTFYLFFLPHTITFNFPCTCYLLNVKTIVHTKCLKLFIVFVLVSIVFVTISTAGATTLHINSLKQVFAEAVSNTFFRDFLQLLCSIYQTLRLFE